MKTAGEIVVVSGLPRSGTSMMMRILAAGGLEIVADGLRVADHDNPHGYFEFEGVKALAKDSRWLESACGKVVKVVSELLSDLPPQHNYRVVFMRRHIDEILASQREMLTRSGRPPTTEEDRDLRLLSIRHLNEVIDWLKLQPNMKTLYVNYGRAPQHPEETVASVNAFLGGALDLEAMRKAIDASLYRNRHVQTT